MSPTFFEDVRAAVVSAVNSAFAIAHPDVAIVFDNGPFDWNDPPTPFVEFEVEWQDSDQINLAVAPKTRFRGQVNVTVYSKQGTGTKQALELLGWFSTQLAYAQLGRARLQHATMDPSPEQGKGWVRQSLCVGFHCDTE